MINKSRLVILALLCTFSATARSLLLKATIERNFFISVNVGNCVPINDSEVVTCYHLICDSRTIKVIDKEKTYRDISVSKISPEYNLAILTLKGGRLNGPFLRQGVLAAGQKVSINYSDSEVSVTLDGIKASSRKLSSIRNARGNQEFSPGYEVLRLKKFPANIPSGGAVVANNTLVGIFVKTNAEADIAIPIRYLNDMRQIALTPSTLSWPGQSLFVDTQGSFSVLKDTSSYLAGYYKLIQSFGSLVQNYSAVIASRDTFTNALKATDEAAAVFLKEPNILTFDEFIPVYKQQNAAMRGVIQGTRTTLLANSEYESMFDSLRRSLVDVLSAIKFDDLTDDQKRMMNERYPGLSKLTIAKKDSLYRAINIYNEKLGTHNDLMEQHLKCSEENPNRPYDTQAKCLPQYFLPAQEALNEAVQALYAPNTQNILLQSGFLSCAIIACLLSGI